MRFFFFSAHVVCDIKISLLLYLLDVKTPWCYVKYVKSISLNNPHAKPDFLLKIAKTAKARSQWRRILLLRLNYYIWKYLILSATAEPWLPLLDNLLVSYSVCCPKVIWLTWRSCFETRPVAKLHFLTMSDRICGSFTKPFQLPSNFNFLRCCVRIVTMVPPLSTTTTRHELRTPVLHK